MPTPKNVILEAKITFILPVFFFFKYKHTGINLGVNFDKADINPVYIKQNDFNKISTEILLMYIFLFI